jgi:hypothetical protein
VYLQEVFADKEVVKVDEEIGFVYMENGLMSSPCPLQRGIAFVSFQVYPPL